MIRRLRWPLLIALLALAVIAVLLVEQKPAGSPVIPVVEPATGGIYAEGLIGSLIRLNPLLDYYNSVDHDIDRLLFNGLVKFDDRGIPQGNLVDSWGISRDGTIFNFSLRENAVWHDQEPVTSDDVIFTIERMREEDSPIPTDVRELWKQVEVVRLDEKTLQFRLLEPYSPFLDYLTFGILPEHIFKDHTLQDIIASPYNLQPIGTGPYRFKQLIVEEGEIKGILLEAFEGYFDKSPFIEQIIFRYYPNAQLALQAYLEGEILGLSQVSPEILQQVLQEPDLNLYTGRLPKSSFIIFNLNNPQVAFLQMSEVRRALLAGLNRRRMIDRLLNGQAILADGPIFPGTWAYYDGIDQVEYDSDVAIELLKQAGFTIPSEGGSIRKNEEGISLAFEMLYLDDELHRSLAEAIQLDWKQLGVDVTVKAVTDDDLMLSLNNRTHQAALVELNLARSPDPDPYPFWHQSQVTGGQNYAMWDDRQASEFLEQARITFDMSERTRLYRNFQVRFAQELPSLPLFYPVYRYAVDVDVQGIRMGSLFDPADRFTTIAEWFLVTRRSSGMTPISTEVTSTLAP